MSRLNNVVCLHRAIGQADLWETVIYPGMKESITGTLLAAQEHMEHRKNCFELYGADFMLTDDMVPWLIEINSSPCMSPTTSVTARMCSQCLEDVIKGTVIYSSSFPEENCASAQQLTDYIWGWRYTNRLCTFLSD